jgi:hypothetical protein
MINFPGSPRLLKGGIALLDPTTAAVQRIIALQYNPDTITRTLQVQGVGDSPDRSEALRLKAPAVETIKLDAEIDVTDQLELPDSGQNRIAVQLGLYPQMAALETLIYPSSDQLLGNDRLARAGTLEIVPMETALTLFIWSQNRIVPVRVTELSITEEAFGPDLNPIRAKVSLGMRVLTVNDLGFDQPGGNVFMVYLKNKERLRGLSPAGTLAALGVGALS